MLTAAEFTQLLNATGVTVSHRQAKPPHTVTQVKVVPGSVDKRSESTGQHLRCRMGQDI